MMDLRGMPFDTGSMLAGLRTWVECESPTWDAVAVNRMMDLAARDLALMGAHIDRIPGRMSFWRLCSR
jgi:glutamate carboxypeptidase